MSGASLPDGAPQRIGDPLPAPFEAKLFHHLPLHIVLGPQQGVGLDPAGESSQLLH